MPQTTLEMEAVAAVSAPGPDVALHGPVFHPVPAREIALRPFPYPYEAMLAICSDLDETPDASTYFEIARYLNTHEMTRIGPGVGLEIGNSIYFDMPPSQFSYGSADQAARAKLRALIHSGHIDCLHSYGDLAATRAHAGRALEELSRYDCRLEVWVDHAAASTNFGADIMRGSGDVPGAEAYHADLTCQYGIRYVWRGRVTSVIGQDVPRRLHGIFDASRPASARTFAKEWAKGVLGRLGSRKYAIHAPNRLLRRTRLRDGRLVLEFLRSNPYFGGVEKADTADGIALTLNPATLDRLIQRRGVCVFYTHLGKRIRRDSIFDPAVRAAFERIAELCRSGKLLVTTTRRLLAYRRAVQEVAWSARRSGDITVIEISTRAADHDLPQLRRGDLDGLTFYLPAAGAVRVLVDGTEVATRRNPPDAAGRNSVSIPWRKLEFPNL